MRDIHKNRLYVEQRRREFYADKSYKRRGKSSKVPHFIKSIIKFVGLYKLGLRNAIDIQVKSTDIISSKIPSNFNNYKIMFIADLHLDGNRGIIKPLKEILSSNKADLYLLGGDYQFDLLGDYPLLSNLYQELFSPISTKPIIGVLGNHDEYAIAESFEEIGITMLINESIAITKGDDFFNVMGLDDTHRFKAAKFPQKPLNKALFNICLSHSSEIYKSVNTFGYDYLLSGHSHGGQICLPGRIPLIKAQKTPYHLNYGKWHYKKLMGYTTSGVGTTCVNLRYFSPPEVVIFTLKAK